MRELILQRIQEIKKFEQGFINSEYRWSKYVRINNEHISKVDFSLLNDEGLLDAYDLINRRYNAVM